MHSQEQLTSSICEHYRRSSTSWSASRFRQTSRSWRLGLIPLVSGCAWPRLLDMVFDGYRFAAFRRISISVAQ